MARKSTAARRSSVHKSLNARKKTARVPLLPSDEESIALRQAKAAEERAAVTVVTRADGFHGVFHVASTQWDEPYTVEMRAIEKPMNTCTCRDFHMNRLGTCKHIERVRQHLAQGNSRRYAAAARRGSPFCEVFLDVRAEEPVVRWQPPKRAGDGPVRDLLDRFFSADGSLLGDPVDAIPALKRAIARAPALLRRRVRISGAVAPHVEQLRRRRGREQARTAFLEDVRAGKRTMNPLRAPLYPYQQEGMLHLAFGERAMLADEMGLGKTVQAIAACELLRQLRGVRRALVVCPASLKAEWEDQIRQFSGRTARLIYGRRPARLRTYRENHFWFVGNYEQVRGDLDEVNDILAPDVVILDEAQRIKNWPTKTAKTIKRLRSPYAFVLTGTPLENRLEEIYSLVEFLDPQLFGSLFRFQREFFRLDEDGGLAPRNLGELHRRVRSVMLRRRKADVEGELPERTIKTFFVPMADEQRARYDEFAAQASRLVHLAERRPLKREEFERLQRLLACMRMVCDTPAILDPECRICPKLDELAAVLDEALADPETKVLLFSEWVRMLELVRELAEARGIGFAEHTGRIDQRRRREEIHRFKKDPTCRLFLSSESGGTGLNLQAANVVVNLDLPWNPARLEQRIARAWRKHQTRSVRVVNLVTEDSIEHAMLDKLAFKRRLAESVLDGAAPSAELLAGRGRRAYLQQVNLLMGAGAAESASAPAAPGKIATLPTGERLKQDLAARLPAQLLGIEAAEDRKAYLVVTRHREDAAAVRAVAREVAPEARVEVLDRETYELIARLRQQGLIAFTVKTRSLYHSPELGAKRVATAPPRFREAALSHLATVARKRRMATVLLEGDLSAEAMTPAREAWETGAEALHVFCHGQPPDAALRPVMLHDLAGRAGLTLDLAAHAVRLDGCDPQAADAADTVRETLRALDTLEAHFHAPTGE